MAAGLGYKEFTTGDVLTAADANGYLASQVVMVFADAAARTTAITSPQEGMIAYLKDTNATQYYSGSAWVSIGGSPLTTKGDVYTYSTTDARLAVGANGTILTADSAEATGLKWTTPAPSSGWTKVTSSAFSAQTAVSVNNCFTSTFKNYRVLINFTCSASDQLRMRFRVSGADNTTSNYNYAWQYQNLGTGTANVGLQNGTYLYLQDTVTGALGHFYTLDIADPQTSSHTMLNGHTIWNTYFANAGGYFNAGTVFDGLTIYPAAGNITGTISIYGYGA
jgi:hypothetical protein